MKYYELKRALSFKIRIYKQNYIESIYEKEK